MDKPLNHTTIAADLTHSHRPHEKEGEKEGSLTSMAQARQTKAQENHSLRTKSYDTGTQEIA